VIQGIVVLLCYVGNAPVGATADASPDVSDPQAMVESLTTRVLTVLEAESANDDPAVVYCLLKGLLTPHIDFEGINRWVLGRHWKTMAEEQRARFRNTFPSVLIRTALAAIGDPLALGIGYAPIRPGDDPGLVVVRSILSRPGAQDIQVDYRLRKAPEAWLVQDIVIDGISFVVTYRNSFAEEIETSGVAGLIENLEAAQSRAYGERADSSCVQALGQSVLSAK
jgi:phospholipid transport system substrate-binding protein